MTPGERFQRDPVFHNLVKLMLAQLRDANMTGTEIREAAILAAQMHELELHGLIGRVLAGEVGEPYPSAQKDQADD